MISFLRSLSWQSPALALLMMTCASQIALAAWFMMIDNFVIDAAKLNGSHKGLIETVREIPGFLAFLAVFLIIFIKEQRLALLMLVTLGTGVALTGFFPYLEGILLTVFIASIGFHYFETMNQSLSLQWLEKHEAPQVLANILSMSALVMLMVLALISLAWKILDIDFKTAFLIPGSITVLIALFLMVKMPHFESKVKQNTKIVLRKRYWLYYALTFMGGARRQIFTVFAGFLMVEKFKFSVDEIGLMFFINGVLNFLIIPYVGKLITIMGERRALILEYIGLIGVFSAYAFVQDPMIAAFLYILDHAFFSFAIAQKTYFQKIADPADIAPTAGVAFTINHIAAVCIPVALGLVWLISPSYVFLTGAALALVSLVLSFLVPRNPDQGHETLLGAGRKQVRV